MADNGFYARGGNIIVSSDGGEGGGLNWISNLIKHLTLDHSFRFSGHQSARVKYSLERGGRFSRELSRVLVIISHVRCHERRAHITQSARVTLLGTLLRSEIVFMRRRHPDHHEGIIVISTKDKADYWCDGYLEMLMTNSGITRMRDSDSGFCSPLSSPCPVALSWQWMFSTNRRPLSRDPQSTSWDSWTLSSTGVHISWYWTGLEN